MPEGQPLTKVKLLPLEPYIHLFPKARVVDITVKKGATVADTVNFIPQIVKYTSWQVKKYVQQELQPLPLYDALKKLWEFLKYRIDYAPDRRNYEECRTPRRLIHDKIGDCDCKSIFIDCCLRELKVKTVINRITKYSQDHWQHIYPIVPIGNGKFIIMDSVAEHFNYEVPYTEKQDYPMDLQLLDGIEDIKPTPKRVAIKEMQVQENDLGSLGKILKRAASNKNLNGGKKAGIFKKPLIQKKSPEKKVAKKEQHKKTGKKILKVVNKINKYNPAAIILRAGLLASMKLNELKVAQGIKWGYATPEYAESKGMDMTKYDKVKSVLHKTEQIFFATGGTPENLKKSILTGKGNRNHEVAGIERLEKTATLQTLLGLTYDDEFINGMEGFEGFGELGEPATATSLAAAAATMGVLATLLKSIGDLFPNKQAEPKPKKGVLKKKPAKSALQEQPTENNEGDTPQPGQDPRLLMPVKSETESNEEIPPTSEEPTENVPEENTTVEEPAENLPAVIEENAAVVINEETTEATPETPEEVNGIFTAPLIGIKAFYNKNKEWVVPAGIITGLITAAVVVDYFNSKSTAEQLPEAKTDNTINGIKSKSKPKPKKKGGKRQYDSDQDSVIALM